MVNKNYTAALTLMVLLGNTAQAEPCEDAYALEEPCEGVLLPTADSVEALKCLDVDLPEAEAAGDRLAAELGATRQVVNVLQEAFDKTTTSQLAFVEALDKQATELALIREKPDNSLTWAAIGLAGGVLLGALGTVAVYQSLD